MASVSTQEDSGYVIYFESGPIFFRLKGSDIDSTQVLGVKKGKVYRLQGKPIVRSKGILDHGSMSMTEVKEQKTSKANKVHRLPVWGVDL